MRSLLQEYIPHAPHLGLHVAPNIPSKLVRNACSDYAPEIDPEDVIALYDATLLQSGKDGAVFLDDRFVFQNHDLESPQLIRYGDIVGVREDKKWFGLGGAQVSMDVNQGRATVTHTLDFSGKKDAAAYVARFLHEAMLYAGKEAVNDGGTRRTTAETDAAAVRRALQNLVDAGKLTMDDFDRMMDAL